MTMHTCDKMPDYARIYTDSYGNWKLRRSDSSKQMYNIVACLFCGKELLKIKTSSGIKVSSNNLHNMNEQDDKLSEDSKYGSTSLIDAYVRISYSVNTMTNHQYKLICSRLLNKYQKELMTSPASKNHHHNFKGGLVIHTAEVIMNILQIVEPAHRDFAIAAALFHDIGKIKAFDISYENGIYKIEYHYEDSDHHINDGLLIAAEIIDNTHVYNSITDCILSHHGFEQFGAKVPAETHVQWCLFMADLYSAKTESTFKGMNIALKWDEKND